MGRWRKIGTDTNGKGAVLTCYTLIHHAGGDQLVKPKKIAGRDGFFLLVFFHKPKRRQLIQNFLPGPPPRLRNRPPLLQGPYFFQG